jgi:hypothetical protein
MAAENLARRALGLPAADVISAPIEIVGGTDTSSKPAAPWFAQTLFRSDCPATNRLPIEIATGLRAYLPSTDKGADP